MRPIALSEWSQAILILRLLCQPLGSRTKNESGGASTTAAAICELPPRPAARRLSRRPSRSRRWPSAPPRPLARRSTQSARRRRRRGAPAGRRVRRCLAARAKPTTAAPVLARSRSGSPATLLTPSSRRSTSPTPASSPELRRVAAPEPKPAMKRPRESTATLGAPNPPRSRHRQSVPRRRRLKTGRRHRASR